MRKIGYSADQSRGKGSHTLLGHPNRHTLTVPNSNPLGRGILRKLPRRRHLKRRFPNLSTDPPLRKAQTPTTNADE